LLDYFIFHFMHKTVKHKKIYEREKEKNANT